jgi:hypothetical protein
MNDFTQFIHDQWIDFSTKTLVRLRDGMIVEPIVFLGEDDWEDDYKEPRGFRTEGWNYCWNLDGTSVTRPDYDMMEILA